MSVTIQRNPAGATIAPDLLFGYSSSRASGNKIHALLNNQAPPVYDLNPSGWRTGTFQLLFKDRAAAFACEAQHAAEARFTLIDTQIPQQGMLYVVDGAVTLEPSSGGTAWIVTVPFQEIAG